MYVNIDASVSVWADGLVGLGRRTMEVVRLVAVGGHRQPQKHVNRFHGSRLRKAKI